MKAGNIRSSYAKNNGLRNNRRELQNCETISAQFLCIYSTTIDLYFKLNAIIVRLLYSMHNDT
jgi:hypothetical protein